MMGKSLSSALLLLTTLGLGVLFVESAQAAARQTASRHATLTKQTPTKQTAPAKKSSAAKAPTNTKSGAKSSGSRSGSGTTSKSATTSRAPSATTPGTTRSSGSKSGKRGARKTMGGRQRGQTAPTPERIGEIQQALLKNGAVNLEPSGKWDDSTAEAMRKFQAAHGLSATGKLDAPTLNQLGLGATTAGVAPPTPSIKTSSTSPTTSIPSIQQ
jgi:Putative peptidoglycan binding domain